MLRSSSVRWILTHGCPRDRRSVRAHLDYCLFKSLLWSNKAVRNLIEAIVLIKRLNGVVAGVYSNFEDSKSSSVAVDMIICSDFDELGSAYEYDSCSLAKFSPLNVLLHSLIFN